MKKGLLLCLVCSLSWSLCAQRADWSLSLTHFFDNTEFEGSSFQHPQTMAGVWLDPGIGLELDSFNSLHAGVNLLKEYGTLNLIDDKDVVSYYAYQRGTIQFLAGSFPRDEATRTFSKVFFQDSINFYRPNMTGVWWHYSHPGADAGLFLDWTGKKSGAEHEAFFVGATGTLKRGSVYATLQALLRHHAASQLVLGVQENALCQLAFGLDLTRQTRLDTLTFQVGCLVGGQRDRKQTMNWSIGKGVMGEVNAAWKKFGLLSTWYFGGGLMPDYDRFGTSIYWGDPFFCGKLYGRTDVTYDFYKQKPLVLQLKFSHHFSEKMNFVEQSLVGIITINGKK